MGKINLAVQTAFAEPFLNYRFRVRWADISLPILGVKKVSALKVSTKVNEYLCGGEPGIVYKVPSTTTYEPITLERGVTFSAEFKFWASQVQTMGHQIVPAPTEPSLPSKLTSKKSIRRDIVIDVYDSAGVPSISYRVYDAWISAYQSIADLDGEEMNKILYETLTVEHNGWQMVAPPKSK